MHSKAKYRNWLTCAVTISLLGGFGSVEAATVQSNAMVSVGNNSSDSTTPYDSITVSQNSANSSFAISPTQSVYLGIGQNAGTPLVVYVGAPPSGIYNVVVTNDGSNSAGTVTTAGVGSMAIGAVTVHGPLAATVISTGAAGTRANAEALGLAVGNQGSSMVTDDTILSVTAVGGTGDSSAKATAKGVTVDNTSALSNIIMGTTTGTNNINVIAKGGKSTATGSGGADVSATAYGAEVLNVLTFKGNTYIYATAEGGTPDSGGAYIAGSATAEAYGVYNSGGTVNADKLVIGTAKATGGRGISVTSSAYGLVNNTLGSITTGELRLEDISAQAGVADSAHEANATAIGVNNESGSVTTGAFYTKVNAAANTSDSGASATAIGMLSGKNPGDAATLIMGTDNGSNEVHVTATGGVSTANNTNNSFIGLAFGLLNNSDTTLKGETQAEVTAIGGSKAPGNVSLGSGYALAYGIYNQGTNLQTGDLRFTSVQATALTGTEVHAEAYGLYNAVDGATTNMGNLALDKVVAYGGGASTGGTSDATAYGLQNLGSTGKITAGNVTGTITSYGGSGGSTANAIAMGVNNKGTMELKSLNLTVDGQAGTGSSKARSRVAGIMNNGTLSLTEGVNSLNITAQGGKSSGTAGDGYGLAVGINNVGQLTLAKQMTINIEAMGGGADAGVPGSQAAIAWTQAYGVFQSGGQITADKLVMEQVKTTSGSGAEVQALAVGIANQSGNAMTVSSFDMKNISAEGGKGTQYAFALAAGISNESGSVQTTDANAVNNIKAAAKGGTISGSNSAAEDAYAEAYGISNFGSLTLQGKTTIDVEATGGQGTANSTYATAVGIKNKSSSALNVTGPLDIVTNATVVAAGAAEAEAKAAGIANFSGTTNIKDDVKIAASATGVSGNEFYAASVYGEGGTVNVGTDGSNSLGKIVQLEGDVLAKNNGTTININLDQAGSYLQGNVQEQTGGIVNLIVGNGATWRPVFDNRNGTYFDKNNNATFSKDYGQDTNSINSLTLNQDGNVDLVWDNATRSNSFRTLTIASLSGDGGIVKINSDLANNKADQISLGNGSTTASLNIDVKYDPYLATAGLVGGNNITGSALVVTGAGSSKLTTVNGVPDSYNTYDYVPTITKNVDGTYSLTKLAITNAVPTPTPGGKTTITSPSVPMKEAQHAGMAMHNLWVSGELNNMQKRMGDLRAAEPAEAGIWARYEYNKLEKGSDSSLKYNYFQLGYDKDYKSKGGTFYRGVAFSYAKGTGAYEVGTGDLKVGAMTLYQTWVGKGGNYYDLAVKGGRLTNNYNVTATATPYTSDYHSWGYSIGGEVGKRIRQSNGFFVEPQVEFTLSRINGADYTTSTGLDVNVDARNSAIARIGVAVGREIKNVGSYYAKASYYHDFGKGINLVASDSTTNPFSYGEDGAKNWGVFTLGGSAKIGKNCNIFGEVSKYTGQLTNNLQVNVGARWSF